MDALALSSALRSASERIFASIAEQLLCTATILALDCGLPCASSLSLLLLSSGCEPLVNEVLTLSGRV